MPKTRSFASLAIAGATLALVSSSAYAVPTTCTGPAVGNDTSGPALCITLNSNGTASVTNGPGSTQGPYDGVEDTYIGVVNNTSMSISSISLSSTQDIFGFDGDGIGGGSYTGQSGTVQYGTPNSSDTSGYGGPDGFFTNIDIASTETGTLNFITPLAPGGTTFFSLEEALDSASFTAQVSATPVPAALPLFATGVGTFGFFGWRKKRKTAAKA